MQLFGDAEHAARHGSENDITYARAGLVPNASLRVAMVGERETTFGPGCFCATTIEATDIDPCQVTVETAKSQ
jgi:hypothetical protein